MRPSFLEGALEYKVDSLTEELSTKHEDELYFAVGPDEDDIADDECLGY